MHTAIRLRELLMSSMLGGLSVDRRNMCDIVARIPATSKFDCLGGRMGGSSCAEHNYRSYLELHPIQFHRFPMLNLWEWHIHERVPAMWKVCRWMCYMRLSIHVQPLRQLFGLESIEVSMLRMQQAKCNAMWFFWVGNRDLFGRLLSWSTVKFLLFLLNQFLHFLLRPVWLLELQDWLLSKR